MLSEVENFIITQNLFTKKDRLLLAISGGIDSVVLLHVLLQLDFQPVLAHCNFSLRGAESDGDEQFVKDLAQEYNLKLLTKRFDTKTYATQNSISTQMAARELRYNWFSKLSEEHGFTKIVLGHHRDDQLETFFINLFRGSGITGLKAMLHSNGLLVRPLLDQGRKEIEAYAHENGLEWREDSSNQETIYLRNKIRHGLLNEIASFDQQYLRKMSESITMLQREEALYRHLLTDYFSRIRTDNVQHSVNKNIFLNHPEGLALLYEYLKSFGFNYDQARQIFDSLNQTSGKQFFSASYQLLIDRNELQIRKSNDIRPEKIFEVHANEKEIFQPIHLEIKQYEWKSSMKINKDPSCAMLDFDQLHFPLKLRIWQQGDRFRPIGMKGSKLISDYFIDEHLSVFEKEKVWLLVNENDEIVWLVGHRIDDHYKITPKTRQVYQLNLLS
ncbi:MAG: tRNA lysidine(34) synthetase TilS [Bacteroidales bacterium]|nr:tRNA lysidine(34) synthetase TilS [Bacteroidales bacterium]HOI31481.1 tRNA lysidine(34) synthetase TilS [Bacteroidales bacterium]